MELTPLVLAHGSAVTTRQIAEAAEVAEGTIFRVFPDKVSLVEAVVGEAHDEHGRLGDEVGVEVRVAETCGRCVERGVCEVEVGTFMTVGTSRPVTSAAIAT